MKTKAIDFMVYNVSDMEKAVAFYRNALGVQFALGELTAPHPKAPPRPAPLLCRSEAQPPSSTSARPAAAPSSTACELIVGRAAGIIVNPYPYQVSGEAGEAGAEMMAWKAA